MANYAAEARTALSILLGNGDGTFTATASPAGNAPTSIVAADFNGDGKLDLAVGVSSGSIAVLLGNGNGTFSEPALTPVQPGYMRLASADFNGDGRPDLAVANLIKGTTILSGNGDGTFHIAGSVQTAVGALAIITGDFNGDGKPDVAVGVANDVGTVTIALGNGNGTFGTPQNVPLLNGLQLQDLAAADFNEDGKLDLAVTDVQNNRVVILLGNGNGGFSLQSSTTTTGSQPFAIAVGDFNGDGKPDFVTRTVDPRVRACS